MKFLFCLLLLLAIINVSLAETKALPFSVSTSSSVSPAEAKITLNPKSSISFFGVKKLVAGVKFPDCSNSFTFYICKQTKISHSFIKAYNGKTYSKTISIKSPRVCFSDLGFKISGVNGCFSVKNLYLFKGTGSGKIYADISVGFTGIQFSENNILLYSFIIGDVQANPCATKTSQSTCAAVTSVTCGWCQQTKECFEIGTDRRTDACRFCPRCSYMIATVPTEMKKECLGKTSCGWCESEKRCYSGDDKGPHDPDEQCKTGWSHTVSADVTPIYTVQAGDVSGYSATFLSFFWLIFGSAIGLVVSPICQNAYAK
eukprot:gene10938-3644_t